MQRLLRPALAWLWAFSLLALCAACQAAPSKPQPAPEPQAWLAFDGDPNEACFSDDQVDMSLGINTEDAAYFQLTLVNKTSKPLVVHWEKVLFLDAAGNVQRLLHHGVGFGDPLESLTPTMLGSMSSLSENLLPAKVVMDKGQARLAPLKNPLGQASGQADLRLSVELPLEVDGILKLYRFRFHLDAAPEPTEPTEPAEPNGTDVEGGQPANM